ncbi:MAG: hypothetical protein MJY81_07050, partial [Bacteroidaceae bacterium]|nr:hypothetical protein [Bacteroidaceae bacterium]
LGAHVSASEFQYPDHSWKVLCGIMTNECPLTPSRGKNATPNANAKLRHIPLGCGLRSFVFLPYRYPTLTDWAVECRTFSPLWSQQVYK